MNIHTLTDKTHMLIYVKQVKFEFCSVLTLCLLGYTTVDSIPGTDLKTKETYLNQARFSYYGWSGLPQNEHHTA